MKIIEYKCEVHELIQVNRNNNTIVNLINCGFNDFGKV